MTNSVETWINGLKQKKLFLASGLDLLCKHDSKPVDFSFADLSELFADLVGFRTADRSSKQPARRESARQEPDADPSGGDADPSGWDVECEKCEEWFWTDDGDVWMCNKCRFKQEKQEKQEDIPQEVEVNPREVTTEIIGIDCSICLDDCGTKKACNLACGHIFHSDCIDQWKQINDVCPMCKRPIHVL